MLFESENGTNRSFSLNQSASDFKRLVIVFYNDMNGNAFKTCEVYEPDGKAALLETVFANSGGTVQAAFAKMQISGTSCNFTYNGYMNGSGGIAAASTTGGAGSHLFVTKVLGFK